MDYSVTAKKILKEIGGEQNIAGLTHCMTRLRFNLKDTSSVDLKRLENIPGVMGAISKGGQIQIIIGNNVAKCHAEVLKIANLGESSHGHDDGPKQKRKPLAVALDFIASCMTPIIPAFIAGGLLKVLLVVLELTNVLHDTSQTYILLEIFSDAVFYFMPLLVAYTAAKKLSTSIPLAMSLAGILVHPDLISLFGSGEGVSFLGIPVITGVYTSSIIPIMLTVILLRYVEKLVDRITPEWSKNFLKPLLILLITAPISLIALAPLGLLVGVVLSVIINTIYGFFPPLAMGLFAGFMPLIVMAGMHYPFVPSAFESLVTVGYEMLLLPAMFCSNLALGAATLAVAIKTKKTNIRQISSSSSLSAFLAGVTEPALYGVALKYKTPLIAACIGGGVGGVLMGIFRIKAFAFAVPSLISTVGLIPTVDGIPMSNFTIGLIAIAVGIIITFVLTMIMYKDPADTEGERDEKRVESGANISVASPLNGEVITIDKVNDSAFSTEVLGKGYAVVPTEGKVVAPFDGTVENMFETGHAVGIKSDEGVEMLVHIGLETVELKGKYFNAKVKTGDRIKKGQTLIEFDIDKIGLEGYDITTPVVISNSDDYSEFELTGNGYINALQTNLQIKNS